MVLTAEDRGACADADDGSSDCHFTMILLATVIAVSTLLDGRGNVVNNTRVVVDNGKIVRIDPKAEPVNIDLRGLTVMPGFIDTHVTMSWTFTKDTNVIDQKHENLKWASLEMAANAWKD